jgi:hypothetical protein
MNEQKLEPGAVVVMKPSKVKKIEKVVRKCRNRFMRKIFL